MTKDLFNYYEISNIEAEEIPDFPPLFAIPKQTDRKEELSDYRPEFLEGEDVY